MKKIFLAALVIAIIAVGGAFAQEQDWNRFAPALDGNNLFINAGIGFGQTGGYNMGLPPISVSADYRLPIDLPITLGAVATLTTWKYSAGVPGMYTIDVTYRNIGFGVRGMYHFNFMENLDTYAGLTLGYVMQSVTASDTLGHGAGYSGVSFFLWGLNIGARYFFTDLLGAYIELGYSELQYASIGLALKF
jgi:hypothetical protein